jgi:hypothetical protein
MNVRLARARVSNQSHAITAMLLRKIIFAAVAFCAALASANNSGHTPWLGHLHQPIYWPD